MARLAILVLSIVAWTAMAAPPFPGGILDTTGKTAFLAGDEGVLAVELEYGSVLWTCREAHLPLLVAGDQLFAIGYHANHVFSVLALDLTSQGKKVSKTEVTDLPRWIVTQGNDRNTFDCRWEQQKQYLLVEWEATSKSEGGPDKQARGLVRINLETGRVDTPPLRLQAPRPPSSPPIYLEKKAIRWQGRAGGAHLAVVQEELPNSRPGRRDQTLSLHGWDVHTGKASPARELMRGSRLALLQDMDGKHLWLRDAALDSADASPRPWSVVSILDGHEVARVPMVPGIRQATTIGNRAFGLSVAPAPDAFAGPSPRKIVQLTAINLDTQKIIWQRPLGRSLLQPH
ncbi:MAG: hypothetical protein ACKO23_12470 [Gemmataceae bacterium]